MPGVKLVVIYPRPTDVEAFEEKYLKEHMPMAAKNLSGVTKVVLTKVLGSPQGTPPFHRIAELHFPSKAAFDACFASQGARDTAAHAVSISTGGQPAFLLAEEETINF